jgi:hypothetical protein
MTDQDATAANTEMWTAYLTKEWDGWFRASRLDPADMAERTASLLSATFAFWRGLFAAPLVPQTRDEARPTRAASSRL